MKTIRSFFIGLILLSIPSFAQREAAMWYFGDHAGLDFNSGSPVAVTNGQLNTAEGCTSISDKNGNLLFYTDGSVVFDKTHQIMPNGSGLLGHKSSTQSAIIVPKPNNPSIYYIFTVDQPLPANVDDDPLNNEDPPNNGLNYSQIDLRLNNGLGDVVKSEKNIHLITYDPNNSEEVKFKCSEKITAVQHGDGVSFWVITHFINNFYAFKIGINGIEKKPIITKTSLNIPIGGYLYNAIGYLKTSPNGKKLAIANSSSRATNELGPKGNIINDTGNVLLYDFDSDTGKPSNEITLLSGSNPYGLEFSSRTKKLYVTVNKYDNEGVSIGSSLLQFDLKSPNLLSSKTIINSSSNNAGALQLGLDEKIYRSGYFSSIIGLDGSSKLSVINNPELSGSACNFSLNTIDLKTGISKLGLPPFISSLFLYNFSYEFNCFGQSTHFFVNTIEKIDSVVWDFGDGTTSTDRDAYHTYINAGRYKVTLIKTVNEEVRDPIEKVITIYDAPKILSTSYKLIQCDTEDSMPTDGLSTFNLSLANEPLCLGQKDFDVFYYHSALDAESDKTNSFSLAYNYTNSIQDEILYAKITQPNSDCFSIGTVILHANKNILISPENYYSCDIENGSSLFDLDQKKEFIKTELSLPPDVKLYLYSTQNDALLGKNEVNGQYKSNSKTLYIRAENNEGCYGTGKFDLVVVSTPKINPSDSKTLCEGSLNPNILLDAGIIDGTNPNEYSYLWSTNEKTSTITIHKEGNYSVIVKNKSGCTSTHKINVNLSYLAKINTINVQDLKPENIVSIDVLNPNNYQYKIKFQNGISTQFQNSPIFENVPGGFHEIIIENLDGCGQIEKTFAVLDAPLFFTPNNDGQNDYWNLRGINSIYYKNAIIYIYNRYGKFITQISPLSQGWDGSFNGNVLPADDYWFTIRLEDGRESRGHFSLKR